MGTAPFQEKDVFFYLLPSSTLAILAFLAFLPPLALCRKITHTQIAESYSNSISSQFYFAISSQFCFCRARNSFQFIHRVWRIRYGHCRTHKTLFVNANACYALDMMEVVVSNKVNWDRCMVLLPWKSCMQYSPGELAIRIKKYIAQRWWRQWLENDAISDTIIIGKLYQSIVGVSVAYFFPTK